MKILHIIEIRGIGGAEKMLPEFLAGQVEIGQEVYCILLSQSKHRFITADLNEHLIALKIKSKLMDFGSFLLLPKLIYELIKQINAINPDIIHAHLRIAEILMLVIKVLKKKIVTISTQHGYSDKYQSRFAVKRKFKIKRTFTFYIVKLICSRLNGVVFVSDFIWQFYISVGLITKSENFRKIYNAVIVNENHETLKPLYHDSCISLVLPGRLVELKGHIYAFEAVKILKKKYPDIKLDCYGIGDFKPQLLNYISDLGLENVVQLKGFTANIIATIKSYDILVVSSLFESFGLVFLDAFLAKVPVVAFDLPAGNEIIIDGENGLLAIPRCSQSLANQIEKLILDKGLGEKITKNAFKLLNTNYSIKNMVNQYQDFYKSLLPVNIKIDK